MTTLMTTLMTVFTTSLRVKKHENVRSSLDNFR